MSFPPQPDTSRVGSPVDSTRLSEAVPSRSSAGGVRVAVLSGKGGTGKTTIAVNLGRLLADRPEGAAYLDCDVEAPNGHLFLAPTVTACHDVSVPVAEIDPGRCTGCGACAKACRFSAILTVSGGSMVLPELCHGCGACVLACPTGAVRDSHRVVGVVQEGHAGHLAVRQGRLEIGQRAEHAVVRAVRAAAPPRGWVILDAPAGVGCPVAETARGADVVLLVTEPTPAGLHDLVLATEVTRDLGIPAAVVINKAWGIPSAVREHCAREGLSVLLEIPHDLDVARACSRGQLLVDVLPGMRALFDHLAADLEGLVRRTRAGEAPQSAERVPAAVPPSAEHETPVDHGPPGGQGPSSGHRAPREQGARGEVSVRSSASAGPTPAGVPRELVVLSGKGGTGKTSVTAALAALAQNPALVDADVDASNLYLLLPAQERSRWPFLGGCEAVVDVARCSGCAACLDLCRFDALGMDDTSVPAVCRVDSVACEGCGVCVDVCPEEAVDLVPRHSGERFVSETAYGPLSHARLRPGRENSGRLVTQVRREGQGLALAEGRDLVLVDGPPGVGCPAIAALTGAHQVLLVTEPTLSGLHDLRRVAVLADQLMVPAAVCINKADLNPGLSAQLEVEAMVFGLPVLGRLRYDEAVLAAHLAGRCVVEHAPHSEAAAELRELWHRIVAWTRHLTGNARAPGPDGAEAEGPRPG